MSPAGPVHDSRGRPNRRLATDIPGGMAELTVNAGLARLPGYILRFLAVPWPISPMQLWQSMDCSAPIGTPQACLKRSFETLFESYHTAEGASSILLHHGGNTIASTTPNWDPI